MLIQTWNFNTKQFDVSEELPKALLLNPKQIKRFFKAVKKKRSCWEWQGRTTAHGYGAFTVNSVQEASHRIAYRHWVGEIEQGTHIHHKCRNKACCNPFHLEQLTVKQHRQAHR